MEREKYVFFVSGRNQGHSLIPFKYKESQSSSVVGSAPIVAKAENAKLIAFVPHSLSKEDINIIKQETPTAVIVRTPSLGIYKEGKHYKHFLSNASSLTFFFFYQFLRLLKPWKAKNFDLLIDISTGYNQLVFCMLDALRYLSIFLQLSDFDKRENHQINIVYSEPAQPNIQNTYRIYKDPFRIKAFPSTPLKKTELKAALASFKLLLRNLSIEPEFGKKLKT